MTADERAADLIRQLAEAGERNAALTRMMERQGHQLDRMQDQLEKALREIEALRRQLNKPPPDEPPPKKTAVAPADTGSSTPPPPPKPEKPTRKQREQFGRNKLPSGLDRIPDPAGKAGCCACGNIGAALLRRDLTEVYDYVPARLVARQVDRPVHYCDTCKAITQAPLPEDLVPRLLATAVLLAHIIYEKYGGTCRSTASTANCGGWAERSASRPAITG